MFADFVRKSEFKQQYLFLRKIVIMNENKLEVVDNSWTF